MGGGVGDETGEAGGFCHKECVNCSNNTQDQLNNQSITITAIPSLILKYSSVLALSFCIFSILCFCFPIQSYLSNEVLSIVNE